MGVRGAISKMSSSTFIVATPAENISPHLAGRIVTTLWYRCILSSNSTKHFQDLLGLRVPVISEQNNCIPCAKQKTEHYKISSASRSTRTCNIYLHSLALRFTSYLTPVFLSIEIHSANLPQITHIHQLWAPCHQTLCTSLTPKAPELLIVHQLLSKLLI